MTMTNNEPDFDEDGADATCSFCGELLDADGSCPECDYEDEDALDDDDDDLEYEDDIEALIDMEDHLDE